MAERGFATRRIEIANTWDGGPLPVAERAMLAVAGGEHALTVELDAPFHDDPAPAAPAGRLDGLWNHEVVELFLVGDDDRYLELELGPHGHWLALLLQPVRRVVDDGVQIDFHSELDAPARRWRGRAELPAAFVPRPIVRWNAFAIHGRGAGRRYLAAGPVPGDAPDFHRIGTYPPFNAA